MLQINITEAALEKMSERGICEEDVKTAVEKGLENNEFIYNEEHKIVRAKTGNFTVYAQITEDNGQINVESAYAHRVLLNEHKEM